MMPCVLLASQKRPDATDADEKEFRKEWADFVPGPFRLEPLAITLKDCDDQDGGNGTGREGIESGTVVKPCVGQLRKAVWDFAAYPGSDLAEAERPPRDVRFPASMRFELCVLFHDINQALHFVHVEAAGQRLKRLFVFVEIVALGSPAFAPMMGKAALYQP